MFPMFSPHGGAAKFYSLFLRLRESGLIRCSMTSDVKAFKKAPVNPLPSLSTYIPIAQILEKKKEKTA